MHHLVECLLEGRGECLELSHDGLEPGGVVVQDVELGGGVDGGHGGGSRGGRR